MPILDVAAAIELGSKALIAAGTSSFVAETTARALVAADCDGQAGHGLSRVPSYAAQVKAGKIRGKAELGMTRPRPGLLHIDAGHGFGFPAVELAIDHLPDAANRQGIAAALIFNSHHIGQAGRIVERLAEQGLVAILMSNTPAAMAFAGGRNLRLGTNPLAFAAPLPGRPPLVIDMALSLVARSKIVAAQKAGQSIPADWAYDADGNPTTDADAAMKGALAPMGGPKGAALALMVEVLCGALAGGAFGWQASSFLDDKGGPPSVGQILIAIEPSSSFLPRMAELAAAFAEEPGVRIPGDRRLAARDKARLQGLTIPDELYKAIVAI